MNFNSLLDYQVVATDGDLLTIQFQVTSSFAATLPSLLGVLGDSLRMMSQRARVVQAVQRAHDPEEIRLRQEQAEKYKQLVLNRFDVFVSKGSTPKAAVRLTRDYFVSRDMVITCYEVQMFARQAGRFRKQKTI